MSPCSNCRNRQDMRLGYWCRRLCAVCLGEWGAWRAVVIDILHRVAYEEGKIGYESWWPSVAIIRTELAAVGWSP